MTNEKMGSSVRGWNIVAVHAVLILVIIWISITAMSTMHWSFPLILVLLAS